MVSSTLVVLRVPSSGRGGRPWRRRRARRGVTVFVVLLVIGMLAAVGLFAARASQLGISNAGRHRQMMQTHFLSEMGLLGTVSELERDPVVYKNKLNVAAATPPTPGAIYACRSVPYLKAVPAHKPADERCIRIGYDTIENQARKEIGGLDVVKPTGKTGTGHPIPGGVGMGDVLGNFAAEVTDLTEIPVPVAGYAVGSTITADMKLYRFTVLSSGQLIPTQPDGTAYALGTDEFRYLTSIEQTRAHVIVGPIK